MEDEYKLRKTIMIGVILIVISLFFIINNNMIKDTNKEIIENSTISSENMSFNDYEYFNVFNTSEFNCSNINQETHNTTHCKKQI